MSRPIKDGLDYFPFDTTFDDEIEMVQAVYGSKYKIGARAVVIGVIAMLWQKIYREGYYIEWNDRKSILFASQCDLDIEQFNCILGNCLSEGIFDKEMFDRYSILTSKGIQKRYYEIRKKSEFLKFKSEYLLISVPENKVISEITLINSEITPINSEIMPQRKEKESKEKESKEKKSIDYEHIKDMFNDICISLPKITVLSDKRKQAINARLNKYSIEQIETVFKKAQASDFLKGGNNRNWQANFDWLMKDSNICKVLDGYYDNKKSKDTLHSDNFKHTSLEKLTQGGLR